MLLILGMLELGSDREKQEPLVEEVAGVASGLGSLIFLSASIRKKAWNSDVSARSDRDPGEARSGQRSSCLNRAWRYGGICV
jgi:hypothetical protein